MGIVVNLSNGSMITVTVTTTWGYPVVEKTGASTIEAITAAMHSVVERIEAKTEDINTRVGVRKVAKWRHVRNVLIAGHEALAERLIHELKQQQPAAAVWTNWYQGDVDRRDISVPAEWRNVRGGTSVKSWPMAPAGAIVEHDGTCWRVVVNEVSEVYGRRRGYYSPVFSVYAIVPA